MILFVERNGFINIRVEMEDEEALAAVEEIVTGTSVFVKLQCRSGRPELIKRDTIARVFTLTDREDLEQKEAKRRQAERFGQKPENLPLGGNKTSG